MTKAKEVLRELANAIRTYRYDGDDEGAVAEALRAADAVLNEMGTMSAYPDTPIRYNPLTGERWHDAPMTGEEVRKRFWNHVWRYNPWTGEMRDPRDMIRDARGELIRANDDTVMLEVDTAALEKPVTTVKNALKNALDAQVGGGHYKSLPVQPVEYIHKNGIGFCEGNVIKYVSRWRAKGGVEDLKKARHFLDLLIEMEKGKPGQP